MQITQFIRRNPENIVFFQVPREARAPRPPPLPPPWVRPCLLYTYHSIASEFFYSSASRVTSSCSAHIIPMSISEQAAAMVLTVWHVPPSVSCILWHIPAGSQGSGALGSPAGEPPCLQTEGGNVTRHRLSRYIRIAYEITYEVWLKNNGTGLPADMAENPQTIETHDINLQHIAMVRAK